MNHRLNQNQCFVPIKQQKTSLFQCATLSVSKKAKKTEECLYCFAEHAGSTNIN